MNTAYFNPKTELSWYRDLSNFHAGEKEREYKKRWALKVAAIRRKKAAIAAKFTNPTPSTQ